MSFIKNYNNFKILTRAYSVPISFVSWLVPFVFGVFSNGNILFGLIALIGIIILHLATNLFDDICDYITEKRAVDMGIKSDFNFQDGKCILIRSGIVTLNKAVFIDFVLFLVAFLIGLFFIFNVSYNLLWILIAAGFICLVYPFLGCLGLGEVLVAIIFSPLIYSGVYFVMCADYSFDILIFSISTGLLAVAVLHNHMLLDYKFDVSNRKITLCTLCKSEKNSLILLKVLLLSAYINIIFWVLVQKLSLIYLIPLITFPAAYTLIKVMDSHIKSPDNVVKYSIFMGSKKTIDNIPDAQRNFLMKFFLVQNVLYLFSVCLCLAVIIDKLVLN